MNKLLIIFLCLAIASGLAGCEFVQKGVETAKKMNITEETAKGKIKDALEGIDDENKEKQAYVSEPFKDVLSIENKKTPREETTADDYEKFREYMLETTCLLIAGQQNTLAQEHTTMSKYGYNAEDVKMLTQKYPEAVGEVGEMAGKEGCSRFLPPPKDKAGALQDIILEITCKSIAGKVKDEADQLNILAKYGYTKESFKEAINENPEVEQNLGPRLLECKDFIER